MARRLTLAFVLLLSVRAQAQVARPEDVAALQAYVKKGWHDLERTHAQLLAAATDPKFPPPNGKWAVYVAADEDLAAVGATLQKEVPPTDFAKLEILPLPAQRPGILYLPKPYVVPGGRFNEMYGWDSYFIVVGLIRAGEVELARDMVDNFVYEIDRYGTILNANRSYYLTRSQPPFLTQMVLAVYAKTHDKKWLATTVPAIEKYYAFWTSPPHTTPETKGLARYYDLGSGPAAEVLAGEQDEHGKSHYDRVRAWYHDHPEADGDGYALARFYDRAHDELTDLFYVADRSMRESGFDPSNRFGPFNIGVIDYDPVCLNSLLYVMELDTARILKLVKRGKEAPVWTRRAAARKQAVDALLWDDASGLYLDYDFTTGKRRSYPFGTTFFPLWAGLASPAQAKKLAAAALPLLERPGGLVTSTVASGNQWDAPFGWAPLELIAVQGLRRYRLKADADRIAENFLSLVLKEHMDHNAIFEKYDVVDRKSAVAAGIKFGYSTNEIGFGWTNAAWIELYAGLDQAGKENVRKLSGVAVPNR